MEDCNFKIQLPPPHTHKVWLMHDAWLAKSILKCIAAKSYEAWGKLKAIKSSPADSCVSLRRLIEFCRHENFTTYKTEGIVDRMVDTNDDRTNNSNDVVWKEGCYKRDA